MINYCHTNINPLCPVHNMTPWLSTVPPRCMCEPQSNPVPSYVTVDPATVDQDSITQFLLWLKEDIDKMRKQINRLERKIDNAQ